MTDPFACNAYDNNFALTQSMSAYPYQDTFNGISPHEEYSDIPFNEIPNTCYANGIDQVTTQYVQDQGCSSKMGAPVIGSNEFDEAIQITNPACLQWTQGQGLFNNVADYVENTGNVPCEINNDSTLNNDLSCTETSQSYSDSNISFSTSESSFEPFDPPHIEEVNLEDIPGAKSNPAVDRPKRKRSSKLDSSGPKICSVCGDSAKSMHFGGMTCDSCKAFFRRSVQTNSYTNFKCFAGSQCKIEVETRKSCQYCRFQKCLSIGMEVRWVMSETERMAQWRSKLARHRAETSTSSSPALVNTSKRPEKNRSHLTDSDRDTLRHVTILQDVIFSSMPYPSSCSTADDLAKIFFCICQKLQKFFYRIEEFHELEADDQAQAMKNGIATSIYLHGVYMYDVENEKWPAASIKEHLKVPEIKTTVLRQFTVFPEIFNVLMTFYSKYGNEIKDDTMLALLCIIGLFLSSRNPVKSSKKILDIRNNYIALFKRYLMDKHGTQVAAKKFPFILNAFEYVQRIVTYHNKVAIQPTAANHKNACSNRLSFTEQLNTIIEGLKHAKIHSMPQFASVIVGIPHTEYDQEYQFLPSLFPAQPYSWLTSVILGSETRTDRLLSFAHPEVIAKRSRIVHQQHGSNALSLTQPPEREHQQPLTQSPESQHQQPSNKDSQESSALCQPYPQNSIPFVCSVSQ